MQADSTLDAEIKALIFATRWSMDIGFSHFQVEVDSEVALRYVVDERSGRWRISVQEMLLISNRKLVSFRHV
ncbi:unnamed protein product [Cuscuta epithymum]|uniref:RNase H type-1 domain-containing protein n=1 Tax=Cuscuta epithymum TaxID=186058 RepID=A0AAV0DRJ7_9ASTE|nr:unnamed protein product [Cuscuta epithymum]